MNGEIYRQLVRALQYATFTQSDLALVVNRLYLWIVQMILILRHSNDYYRMSRALFTMDCFLNLLIRFTYINCFADSDWGGCPDDRHSTDGFAMYLGSNLIS